MNARAARIVACLTAAYSTALVVEPALLAKPCRLTGADGRVSPSTAALIRSIGTRDAALAATLAVLPSGYPMTVATAARVLSDAADAVWLGRVVPSPQRRKIAGAALAWAALEAVVGILGHLESRR